MNISDFIDIDHNKKYQATYSQVCNGSYVPPIKRLKIFNSDEWEEFTEECLNVLKKEHKALVVKRYSGSGDKGIDVAIFYDEKYLQGKWECYQCKHYDHPLRFSEMCLEFGKIIYYSYKHEYSVPQKYYLVSPCGCGTELSMLLSREHEKLKNNIIKQWDKYCRAHITRITTVDMDEKLLEYINQFDFSIFHEKTPPEMLDIHQISPNHALRFGGGLSARPQNETPPQKITEKEMNYVNKLLKAYGDSIGQNTLSLGCLKKYSKFERHFQNSREAFFSAESLNNFSRDQLPDGSFETLQNEIYRYVENTIMEKCDNGFEKVKKVVQKSYDTPIDSHPLKDCVTLTDKAGICHQLANEDKIDWVEDE